MFNQFSKLILLFAVIVSLGGCHSLPPTTGYSRHDFEIRGSATEEQIRKLDEILDALPEEMVDSIDRVSLQSLEHFNYSPGSVAHVSDRPGMGICFSPFYINDSGVVWHEATHCYENHLIATGSRFTDRWREVAGDVYDGGLEYRTDQANTMWFIIKPPKLGVMTIYGRTNASEDIAEFNQQVYKFLEGGYSRLDWLKHLGLFKTDPRYSQKLGLLHEYGFLNDANYQRVLDFLK